MALITLSGEPGCRFEEVARLTAQRLGFELVSAARLKALLEDEYGSGTEIPDKCYGQAVAGVLARLAVDYHMVVAADAAARVLRHFPGVLRVQVVAPASSRVGSIMLDRRLERPAAKQLLRDLERQTREERRRRFGRATATPELFDLTLNSEHLDAEHMAALVESAAAVRGLPEYGLLPAQVEMQVQFQTRLQLARHGLQPRNQARLRRHEFVHPSEQIFANLLDFYRIAWEYEPRSFPIQWDKDGKVLESFTPDFYLPEFDLYVELTTMKQSLVTKKNRKVKLLRTIYPQVNIQVFYEKDFQNLIFKYGLPERIDAVPKQ
jgi:cytidylate kinase